jgi:hypothetical protein
MRRFFLTEAANTGWVKQQKTANTGNKRVVYILTKFNGEEVIYDDFWDAVIDAEDKYCMDANMVDGYFETTDEDGLSSYEPVYKINDNAPYDGHWIEEEGTLTEPSMSYEDYVTSTGLTEAGQFPFEIPQMNNWVSRAPVNPQPQTQQQAQAHSAQANTAAANTPKTATKGAFTPKPIAQHERVLLDNFSAAEDRVSYALELYVMFMDRLAPKYGFDLSLIAQSGPVDFFDVENSLYNLCKDVEDTGEWPPLKDWVREFENCIGRKASQTEQAFLSEGLNELNQIADCGWPCIFKDASDNYNLCASNWLDSDCGYDDYEFAFETGWAGNPEADWYDITGSGKDADYLEDTYYSGEASGKWFNKITK